MESLLLLLLLLATLQGSSKNTIATRTPNSLEFRKLVLLLVFPSIFKVSLFSLPLTVAHKVLSLANTVNGKSYQGAMASTDKELFCLVLAGSPTIHIDQQENETDFTVIQRLPFLNGLR